ncbi:MAG: cystathionine gamma-lyase [Novosphingobium sp.]
MTRPDAEIIARMLHIRTESLATGEPIALPIASASMYKLPGIPDTKHQYGRWTNPTWDALEEALAELEQAPVVTFPSGMGAISAVFMAHLRPGDRVLLPSDGYYTSRLFAEQFLVPQGVQLETCATVDFEHRDLSGLRMVFVESPSNPTLDICDIAALSARAKAAGAMVVADNTTMTPLGQRPLDLGADIVVSADTKAINGHSDVLFGHVAARDPALLEPVMNWRRVSGAIPGTFEAWLVHRSLETLEVRYDRMASSAGMLAERFAGHGAVKAVSYPGLPDHPGHEIAKRQMTRFGTVIGLTFADAASAESFIEGCPLIVPATSFGGVHSSAERRARWGDAVSEGYVRLSVGCEPGEALWAACRDSLDDLA